MVRKRRNSANERQRAIEAIRWDRSEALFGALETVARYAQLYAAELERSDGFHGARLSQRRRDFENTIELASRLLPSFPITNEDVEGYLQSHRGQVPQERERTFGLASAAARLGRSTDWLLDRLAEDAKLPLDKQRFAHHFHKLGRHRWTESELRDLVVAFSERRVELVPHYELLESLPRNWRSVADLMRHHAPAAGIEDKVVPFRGAPKPEGEEH
jgi:hypothetical protein